MLEQTQIKSSRDKRAVTSSIWNLYHQILSRILLMEVRIKSSDLVKPAEPTWTGTMSLSELDQIGVITHSSFLYFYEPSDVQHLPQTDAVFTTLKDSLSQALVHFYPLAGRLSLLGGGRLELRCNGMGAEVTKAESSVRLDDLRDYFCSRHHLQSLFPPVDKNKSVDELPLFLVQLTTFGCGSISIGISISHAVADGQGMFHFLSEWARISRGEALETPPHLDRTILTALEFVNGTTCREDEEDGQPPLIIGQKDDLEERKKKTVEAVLRLSKDQVEGLKANANGDQPSCLGRRAYSRYETITAHIWRSSCKARQHVHEQPTGLAIIVDGRLRVKPPLPEKYFGNCIFNMLAFGTAGELFSNPLSYTCSKIRQAINGATDEHIRSTLQFFRNQNDLSRHQEVHDEDDKAPFTGNPNLGVVSWLNLPIYNMDFGWGKESYMLPGANDSDGSFVILPSPYDDGSVLVGACLQEVYMDPFKNIFYEGIMEEYVVDEK